MLINFRKEAVLSRISFKFPVHVIKFDPSGKIFAAGVGRLLQIWKSPPKHMEFTPFRLLRTIPGHYDEITSIDWSSDSKFIITGSKDSTCRINAVTKKFKPVALVAHKEPIVACFFSKKRNQVYTISMDGAIYTWKWKANHPELVTEKQLQEIEFSSFEGVWRIKHHHYLPTGSYHVKISSCSLQKENNLLVLGNSVGVIYLYTMPEFSEIHSLSIAKHSITAAAINKTGEWLAFASEQLGQLLVWEWQSETCNYIFLCFYCCNHFLGASNRKLPICRKLV